MILKIYKKFITDHFLYIINKIAMLKLTKLALEKKFLNLIENNFQNQLLKVV